MPAEHQAKSTSGADYDYRAFGLFAGAYLLTLFGDRVAELALPAIVLERHSPAAMGAVNVCLQLPVFLMAIRAGARADAVGGGRGMVGADLARMAAFALIILVLDAPLPILLGLVLVIGWANTIWGVSGSKLLPAFVPRSQLVRANAVLELGDSVATIAGPAAAGALLAASGPSAGLAVNAVSFGVSGVLVAFCLAAGGRRSVPAATSEAATGAAPVDWRAGLSTIRRSPVQRSIQVSLAALNMHSAVVIVALIALVYEDLGRSGSSAGLVIAAGGVGGLLSSMLTLVSGARLMRLRAGAALLALMAAATTLVGLAPTVPLAAVAYLLTDGAASGGYVVLGALRGASCPPELRGRVAGTSATINAAGRLVAAVASTAVLGFAGARVLLLGAAALLGFALLFLLHARTTLNGEETQWW